SWAPRTLQMPSPAAIRWAVCQKSPANSGDFFFCFALDRNGRLVGPLQILTSDECLLPLSGHAVAVQVMALDQQPYRGLAHAVFLSSLGHRDVVLSDREFVVPYHRVCDSSGMSAHHVDTSSLQCTDPM